MKYPKYPYYSSKEECKQVPVPFPPQAQSVHPGLEYLMNPRPISENPTYKAANKLKGKVAIITGGDSGIGRAVAYSFAKEGANLVIPYYNEHEDANETKARIEQLGQQCLLLPGDLTDERHVQFVIQQTIQTFGRLDILVNNHAVQYRSESILDISNEQFDRTFKTNIYAYFYLTKAALPYLKKGSSVIMTTSVTAYEGHEQLLDYSSTQGARVAFIRSLSLTLAHKGIRVNGVAPGPIWTPLTVSTFIPEEVSVFGNTTPMKRAGQPFELAPAYVYLASNDSKYVTGQVLHVNGGMITSS
ncbi:SDR family oxidoreductase [Bacillus sp. CGMCC 1.16541]|uniref:SDR family oxidoreductase n=1 Tax=Bacillus sp. CGMCC 1.16541 TaxID=2185143 RepID=UPI001EF64FD8|nr:SDR family oxidoreductase [Bacillus sp. CGMCC 1.16541]